MQFLFALQLVSLALDGLTGACQDRMRSDHKTAANSMMYWMNMWSVCWSAVGESSYLAEY